MNQRHHHRARRAALAGTMVLATTVLYSATPAHAVVPVVPCTVSLGVTQTATTVTGTPLPDSIDCSGAPGQDDPWP